LSALASRLSLKTPPQVIFASDSLSPPPLAYVTPFPRLSVIISGGYSVELSENRDVLICRLSAGDALFSDKNCWDLPRWDEPIELLTFLFGAKQVGISYVQHDGLSETPSAALKASITSTYDPTLRGVVDLLSMLSKQGFERRTEISSWLTGALMQACRQAILNPAERQPSKANHMYEALCIYLQSNYKMALSREVVAEHFGVSPTHISRLFRTEGQLSFNDYLNFVRIDRAKFLLVGYELPVKNVAANCGFNDVGHFCRVFKKTTKMTPTEYRANHHLSSKNLLS
jgi:AraC-like DNA-binding protein